MKINLDKLRKAGWHIEFERDSAGVAGEVFAMYPPAMVQADWSKLQEVIGKNLKGDRMAIELVLQQTIVSMQKAAVLAVLED